MDLLFKTAIYRVTGYRRNTSCATCLPISMIADIDVKAKKREAQYTDAPGKGPFDRRQGLSPDP